MLGYRGWIGPAEPVRLTLDRLGHLSRQRWVRVLGHEHRLCRLDNHNPVRLQRMSLFDRMSKLARGNIPIASRRSNQVKKQRMG